MNSRREINYKQLNTTIVKLNKHFKSKGAKEKNLHILDNVSTYLAVLAKLKKKTN